MLWISHQEPLQVWKDYVSQKLGHHNVLFCSFALLLLSHFLQGAEDTADLWVEGGGGRFVLFFLVIQAFNLNFHWLRI